MIKITFKANILLIVFFLCFSCNKKNENKENLKPYILTSIFPLKDIVNNIGGDDFVVETFIPASSSPHDFEPSPEDLKKISKADAIFIIGLDLEYWLDKAVKVSENKRLQIIDLSNVVPKELLLKGDPHYWLNPQLIEGFILKKVNDTLISMFPVRKVNLEKNYLSYKNQLKRLNEDLTQKFSSVDNRDIITLHGGFNYFAKQYNINISAVIEESPGKEPDPKEIERLLNIIDQKSIRHIFSEPQIDSKIVYVISKERNLNIKILDPTGNPSLEDRNSYIKLISFNARNIFEALK